MTKQKIDARKNLLTEGLCVATLVELTTAPGSARMWIFRINETNGMVGGRREGNYKFDEFEAGSVRIVSLPFRLSDDPDAWIPGGFVKVGDTMLSLIMGGEFGDRIKSQLKIRDSLLSSAQGGREYLLPLLEWEEIQTTLARKRHGGMQATRDELDHRYCMQCGAQMVRPKEVEPFYWRTPFRCSNCKMNHQSTLETKYCSRCGVKFQREAGMSGSKWAPIANCVDHRKTES